MFFDNKICFNLNYSLSGHHPCKVTFSLQKRGHYCILSEKLLRLGLERFDLEIFLLFIKGYSVS
jgi:hypothetical protein